MARMIVYFIAIGLLAFPAQSYNPIVGTGLAFSGIHSRLCKAKIGGIVNLKAKVEAQHLDRRATLAHLSASQLALFFAISQSQRASAGSVYQAVAEDLKDLIKKSPDFGPTLVRLAWHSRQACRLLTIAMPPELFLREGFCAPKLSALDVAPRDAQRHVRQDLSLWRVLSRHHPLQGTPRPHSSPQTRLVPATVAPHPHPPAPPPPSKGVPAARPHRVLPAGRAGPRRQCGTGPGRRPSRAAQGQVPRGACASARPAPTMRKLRVMAG